MGFEPFVMPKRAEEKPVEGSRDEKVTNLAKLLHARGITSSMADAKRLAEGMVDVERKVVKQSPLVTPVVPNEHADMADTQQHHAHHSAFSIELTASFSHFVAEAAKLSHSASTVQIAPIQATPMAYGRTEPRPIAEVPHIMPHKQMFFEDAPSLSQTRGFGSTTQIVAKDDIVKVTTIEHAPETVVIEERVIVQDMPVAPVVEQVPEPTPQPPVTQTAARTDLAKEHGVDLFEFFKKKS